MNKEEAIELVKTEIALGRSQEEITQILITELKAPQDVVARFIAKVASQMKEPPAPAGPSSAILDPATPASFSADLRPVAEPASHPSLPSMNVTTLSMMLEDKKLTAAVLARIKRGMKRRDLVLWVCEHTGSEWDEAQRYVEEVEISNHTSITAPRKVILTVLGVIFSLSGVGMVVTSFLSLTPLLFGSRSDFSSPIYFREDMALSMLFTGFGMIIGGIVGIYLALQE